MKLFIAFFSIFIINSGFAQNQFSKVKIFANDSQLSILENIGIPTDHGSRKQNTWLITDLSELQIDALNNNDFQFEVLIEDVQSFYIERSLSDNPEDDRVDCNLTGPLFDPTVPTNFSLGTYAGFFTYQEYLDELDAMASAYPNLITVKQPIDTFLTHELRPIYWVRISDNPTIDETEPEVLYTALHHAREPASLSQLIFYMWYLLENYGTNPEVDHVINETELYFVPMLNPDGYLENETNFPNGGGMHRKNKRNIGTSNPGVDLNRNYDYQWNVSGTSPNVNNDTYAGTNAFSEPETQAIKYFCEAHDFSFAMNAHSYGNLLLFPFGWADNAFVPDNDYFQAFSNHQVIFNNYNATKASNLYEAAGDSDDWMYDGDLVTKPKIYALTPEVGSANDGFWPAQSRILPLCKENVWQNTIAAHLPHIFGVATESDPPTIENTTGYFHYDYQRLGLTNGAVSVSMQPIQNITALGNNNTHNINLMDIDSDSISYILPNTLSFGDEVIYVLYTNFVTWSRMDTITKTFGVGLTAYSDNANTTANWSGNWGLTNAYFVSPVTSITDSPGSNYSNFENSSFELSNAYNFSQSTYASAEFYARWEIENDYDYVQFMASTNNGTSWTPLCGQYTNLGTGNQDEDEPLYDNFQTDWVLEQIDLSDYVGLSNVKFKFRLVSDNFVTEDGFAFDDFKIIADGQGLSINEFGAQNFNIYPNPASDILTIEQSDELVDVSIYNQLGQYITSPKLMGNKIDVSNLMEGIYYLKLQPCYAPAVTQKLTIVR
ncbi:MAG: M14 family zinc carboxypeptidase [Crocinitomicaceae bacterium]